MPLPTPPPQGAAPTQGGAGGATTSGWMVVANSGRPGDVPHETTIWEPASLSEGVEPLFGVYKFSYTRHRLFPEKAYQKFPYRVIGKLFFTIPGQGNFVCSASVVNSANNSVVWTAGHCLVSPNPPSPPTVHTNVVFVPGRLAGAGQFGATQRP
jgi:hypothetical protein